MCLQSLLLTGIQRIILLHCLTAFISYIASQPISQPGKGANYPRFRPGEVANIKISPSFLTDILTNTDTYRQTDIT